MSPTRSSKKNEKGGTPAVQEGDRPLLMVSGLTLDCGTATARSLALFLVTFTGQPNVQGAVNWTFQQTA